MFVTYSFCFFAQWPVHLKRSFEETPQSLCSQSFPWEESGEGKHPSLQNCQQNLFALLHTWGLAKGSIAPLTPHCLHGQRSQPTTIVNTSKYENQNGKIKGGNRNHSCMLHMCYQQSLSKMLSTCKKKKKRLKPCLVTVSEVVFHFWIVALEKIDYNIFINFLIITFSAKKKTNKKKHDQTPPYPFQILFLFLM